MTELNYFAEPEETEEQLLHNKLWNMLDGISIRDINGELVDIEVLSKYYDGNWLCRWKNGYIESVTQQARKLGIK